MKFHGTFNKERTLCGKAISEELKFFVVNKPTQITCVKCLAKVNSEHPDSQTNGAPRVTCNDTKDFMHLTISYLVDLGHKRASIASLLNLPHSTFCYLKDGKSRLSLRVAKNIANELNLPLDYLAGNIDSLGNKLD